MKSLTIVTGYDSPGKHDATGAFLPEARAFRTLHGGTTRADGHDNPDGGWLEYVHSMTVAGRRRLAETSIRATVGLDVLAVFGHGTPTSLICTGHRWANVLDLAAAIYAAQPRAASVVLYACSTGAGRVGFADELAYALPLVNVWAHTTAGHSTWNPNVELAGGPRGGDALVTPGEPLWKRWRDRLKAEQAFRLSFWLPGHGLARDAAIEAVRGGI